MRVTVILQTALLKKKRKRIVITENSWHPHHIQQWGNTLRTDSHRDVATSNNKTGENTGQAGEIPGCDNRRRKWERMVEKGRKEITRRGARPSGKKVPVPTKETREQCQLERQGARTQRHQ